MNAILPLNVAALRVNNNDQQTVVNGFKGRTAVFESLPWMNPNVPPPPSPQASTGDTIYTPFQSNQTPANPLQAGVHLHWELPDYFRRGTQKAGGADGQAVRFPAAPNRWLVVRYLRLWNTAQGQWGAVEAKGFIVESDYVSATLPDAVRPSITVPLPLEPGAGVQPYSYMGRVVDYGSWNPAGESPQNYLPSYKGLDGKPLRLTSVGFVGPSFASYYPECSSVFGFWDNFSDAGNLAAQIASNAAIKFKVSYQVMGWVQEAEQDPFYGMTAVVTDAYNSYVAQQQRLGLEVTETPAGFFISAAAEISKSWTFVAADIPFTLGGADHVTLESLTVPTRTLCAGLMQEVVWDMLENPGSTYFLANPNVQGPPSGTWTDTVKLAAGNSTVEALSALLKNDLGNVDDGPDVLKNYEYLLDALQLGLLNDLEGHNNKIILLDELLHTRAFTSLPGGQLWSVGSAKSQGADAKVTLPLELAEALALLNRTQKQYDQARAAVETMRKQLFMDWFRYIKLFAPGVDEPYLTNQQIANFLTFTGGGGELAAVVKAGQAAGVLVYTIDAQTGRVSGIAAPAAGAAVANAVYAQYQAVLGMLAGFANYKLEAAPAPAFNMPADLVVMVEGDMIEPVRRNGATGKVAARLSDEVITSLTIGYSGATFSLPAASVAGVPAATAATPMRDDVQALLGEAFLLVPSMAAACGTALAAQGGANNPAVADYGKFVAGLQSAQGGESPVTPGAKGGLFGAVRQEDYKATANPEEVAAGTPAMTVTFTNGTKSGWAPDGAGWNAQSKVPGFPASRLDPFLPVYLVWKARLRPLNWKAAAPGLMNYSADNLVSYFALNGDAVDYAYRMPGGVPVEFARPAAAAVDYGGAVVLSKKPVFSLTAQIDAYEKNYPGDPADKTLETIKAAYHGRRILSQALSGFNGQQTLFDVLPQIPVEDLTVEGDSVTTAINAAALATAGDNWYGGGFNSVSPIYSTLPAQFNFGPLRSGYLEIRGLTIIDVYGQVMQLTTEAVNADGSLQTIAAMNLQTQAGDTANASWMYLPPRVLAPARLWFRWLSAAHSAGAGQDFVEMNEHPATSPVCGWVVPNHLDNSLFFYEPGGAPVGSFGIEGGKLKYRTQAGNRDNPQDKLELDIGPEGAPLEGVNGHLANFLWYVKGTGPGPGFLQDLMTAILDSDTFVTPSNSAQQASLGVLLGRPLALTRCVLSAETAGKTLPLNQADLAQNSPFPQDVLAGRVQYADRQKVSSGNLEAVEMPVRMGELANMDDGLYGYLIEASGPKPYTTLYAPAGPENGKNGVVRPEAGTVTLTLNAAPLTLTMLVDPRAGVHATAGLVPVAELAIPTEQYAEAMGRLAMTFFTNPVLQQRQGLVAPLPEESGYGWQWIYADGKPAAELQPNQGTEFAVFDYTPQTVQEGWLQLTPLPEKKEDR